MNFFAEMVTKQPLVRRF